MINIPPRAVKVLDTLNSNGFEAYMVGGSVRNALAKLPYSDIDITTSALPRQTQRLFANYKIIPTGLKHGTITVIVDEIPIEITTFRTEQTYSDGRHPDDVQFVNDVEKDCARRDFTMNALCADKEGNVKDFYGGEQDIKDGLIRCVGVAEQRLKEDPLRILRAVRFASQLGFEIEGQTKKAMLDYRQLLKNISSERIYSELCLRLQGKYIKKVLLEYTDIFAVIMPQLAIMKGFDQKNYHHIYDILEHTAVVVENTPQNSRLRVAALLHDFGKPDTFTIDNDGVGHFYNHGEVSLSYAEKFLKQMNVSNNECELIYFLVKYHDLKIDTTEKAVKRALRKFGRQRLKYLLELKRADNKGQNLKDFDRTREYDELENIITRVLMKDECISLKQLAVNGKDITDLGVAPSPITGRILDILLDRVIDGQIKNEKDDLLLAARQIITEKHFK